MRLLAGMIEAFFGFCFITAAVFVLQRPEMHGLALAMFAIGGSAVVVGLYFMLSAGKR